MRRGDEIGIYLFPSLERLGVGFREIGPTPVSPPRRGFIPFYLTKFFLGVVVLLMANFQSFSQEEEEWRVIPSLHDWVEEINNWPDVQYTQRYIEILIDPVKDKGYFEHNIREKYTVPLDSNELLPKLQINKRVSVSHFRFRLKNRPNSSDDLHLQHLEFNKECYFYFLENIRLGFRNCTFNEYAQIRRIETNFNFWFIDSHFKNGLRINNPHEAVEITLLRVKSDKFLSISSHEAEITLSIRHSKLRDLELSQQSKFTEVAIDSSSFEYGISMERMTVNNAFFLTNSDINFLDLNGTQLPMYNSYVPFNRIQNNLTIGLDRYTTDELMNELEMDSTIAFRPYLGQDSSELMQTFAFDQLISSYAKLLAIYKSRNEMRSYNMAYIEMRNKQTAQSLLLYQQDPSFNRYFDYQINRFTKMFSDYGTRPAKAIVIFFQVVLAFSIFYFFFPSSWNTTNSEKLMRRLSHLGGYFTSKEGLSDLFEKETKDRYMTFNEFKDFMAAREKELPFYFQALSKPLYRVTTARFNWTKGFLSRTEILNGKWAELPKGKKALTSILIGLYLLIYLIWVFVIRCLNAITLSLNAFSTLGFGEIPTKGLARYVTIIQGFVGWFLLSIFLVSLIGQILN